MATNATHFSCQLICIEYRLNTYEFNGRSFHYYPGVHLKHLITTTMKREGGREILSSTSYANCEHTTAKEENITVARK